MLIEFRVRNFRSFRDEQILSLVASKDKVLQETNTISSGIKAAPVLLRSAAIYGRNEGGKSNLIKAIQYMRAVVAESASIMTPSQAFGVKPFLLDEETSTLPSEFEATFIINGIRYQYGFALTTERIIREYLLVYKAFKPQQWFVRNYNSQSNKDEYSFGSGLKGQKTLWEKATRPNSLFLSMAVQLNDDQLRVVFDQFVNNIAVFNDITPLNPHFSINMLSDLEGKQAICNFLNNADISIADISVIKKKIMGKAVRIDHTAGNPEWVDSEQEINELQFHHITDRGSAVFNLNDESLGTQRLLFLAGPILDILKKGLTLIVDELDNSLHPLLVRRLVELFHSPGINSQGAQLIFTTHDTSLLDPDLFRRDQIWFVEKDKDQSSKLYPLSDFSPRKNEAFERGYLMGRYGAIPFFNDFNT